MKEKYTRVIYNGKDQFSDLFMPLELEGHAGARISLMLDAAKQIATSQFRSVHFVANETLFIVSARSDVAAMFKEFMEQK